MPLCPRCQEEVPLLEKICHCCGYVMQGSEEESPEKLIGELESVLLEFKSIPRPTFLKSVVQLTYIVFPLLAIYLFVLALMSEAPVFWATGGLSTVVSIYTIVRHALGKLGNDAIRSRFLELKNAHEHLDGILRSRYENDRSIRQRLGEISLEIADVEQAHYAANRHNLYKWIGVGIVCALLGAGGIFTVGKKASAEKEAAPVEAWQEALATFKTSPDNDEYADNTGRMEVLNKILAADDPQAAESFFFDYCEGKVGDFECAKAILRYYTDKVHDAGAAVRFANKAMLRYASDKERLKKLLNK